MSVIEITLFTESKDLNSAIRFKPDSCYNDKERFDYIKKEAYTFFKGSLDSNNFEFDDSKFEYLYSLEQLNYNCYLDEVNNPRINDIIKHLNKMLDNHSVDEDAIQTFEYICIYYPYY